MNFSFLNDPRYDLLGAFWTTVQLTLWAAVGSLVLGTLLAAMRVSPVPMMRGFATVYVNMVRNIPLTVVIIAMSQVLANGLGVRLAVPRRGRRGRHRVPGIPELPARRARPGALHVDVRQRGAAVGHQHGPGRAGRGRPRDRTDLHPDPGIIVLPQAFRAVVAPLGSVLIALTKNTTVASAIGVAEASLLMNTMLENEADKFTAIFLIFALGFIILTLPTGLLFGRIAARPR